MSLLNKKIGLIIQARIGSTRLPAKIMLKVSGIPMLSYQLDRLKRLHLPIYIATTVESQDDEIEDYAIKNNYSFFRGSEMDVLKRYYECAVQHQVDVIIRITSDCPFIDPTLINEALGEYLKFDSINLYYSNTIVRTYPRGADFEIFSFDLLRKAHECAELMEDREHVTPYIWKNKSGDVAIKQYTQVIDYSKYRLTLDTPEDFNLITKLITDYGSHNLNLGQICQIMDQNPQLPLINSHVIQK